VVDTARDAKGLVVDQMDFEAADACIGTGACDLRLEVFLELHRSRGLPRRGVAADEDQLCASVAKSGEGRSGAGQHSQASCCTPLCDSSVSLSSIMRLD
jgi:hypothetical protein